MKSFWIITTVLGFSLTLHAQSTPVTAKEKANQKSAQVAESNVDLLALKIAKGAAIEVDNYDAESDTFELVIVKEPGVGPNVTTFESLQKATGGAAFPKGTSKKKSDLVGAEFTLKEDLHLLSDQEIAKRAKKK